MNSLILCLLSIFAVYGVFSLVREIISLVWGDEIQPDIVVAHCCAEAAEETLRTLLNRRGSAVIYILAADEESLEIAEKLSLSYPRVHILRD